MEIRTIPCLQIIVVMFSCILNLFCTNWVLFWNFSNLQVPCTWFYWPQNRKLALFLYVAVWLLYLSPTWPQVPPTQDTCKISDYMETRTIPCLQIIVVMFSCTLNLFCTNWFLFRNMHVISLASNRKLALFLYVAVRLLYHSPTWPQVPPTRGHV